MKWFTSKEKEAREAALAFHYRALKAEEERDGFRRFFEKYREEAHELTVERDTALAERDGACADNKALRDQLQAVRAERDSLWQDMETIHEITSKHMGVG